MALRDKVATLLKTFDEVQELVVVKEELVVSPFKVQLTRSQSLSFSTIRKEGYDQLGITERNQVPAVALCTRAIHNIISWTVGRGDCSRCQSI